MRRQTERIISLKLGRISRYCTALSRYHKSNGFGIHSPFAFNFVLNVLRERLPYYSYSDIDADRHRLIRSLRFRRVRHQRIISSKNAKMLFRVANYFNPQCIMQIGTNYGMSGRTLLRVSSSSQLLRVPVVASPSAGCIFSAPRGSTHARLPLPLSIDGDAHWRSCVRRL